MYIRNKKHIILYKLLMLHDNRNPRLRKCFIWFYAN